MRRTTRGSATDGPAGGSAAGRRGVLVALALAMVACLALVGCGGGGSGGGHKTKEELGREFVGWWEAESASTTGEKSAEDISNSDLELMRDLGMNLILHLREDGTGQMDMFGSTSDVTWDAAAQTLAMDGESVRMKVEDGKLVVYDDSGSFTFRKGDDSLSEQLERDQGSS